MQKPPPHLSAMSPELAEKIRTAPIRALARVGLVALVGVEQEKLELVLDNAIEMEKDNECQVQKL